MEAIKNLKRISTYAKLKGVSIGWVYSLAKEKKIKVIEIDGIKFVDVNNQKKVSQKVNN